MEGKTSRQQLQELVRALQDKKNVNLFGPPGVGKTWLAKRASARCTRNGTFDFTLWVFMSREYDIKTLSESIGRQLGLLPTTEEWEDVDDSNAIKISLEDEDPETLVVMLMKQLKGKKVLLILDDVPDDETKRKSNEEKFWSAWNDKLSLNCEIKTTLLISKFSREEEDFFTIKVEAMPRADSYSLLTVKLDARLRRHMRIQTLGEKIIKNTDCFPGTVTMIAKVLNYFDVDASGVSMLEKELEELEETEKYHVNKLLTRLHNVLPIGVLKDLWWHGQHFFRDSGSVHYNELITYWILEGYLCSGSMTKLYEKGHHILLELMDCGILKDQENGYFFMDKSLLNVEDLHQCLEQIASLGLAAVFKNDTEGFGNITHDDGMLKTPRTSKEEKNQEQRQSSEESGQNLSTLLLDGIHFSEKVLSDFLESEKELQILALFSPTFKSLPKPLDMMHRLRVLVLRDCAFLEDIHLPLQDLRVLEISGARSLSEMKQEFFEQMPKLNSLNLSELQISYLPQSIYNLAKLQWLIIKDCPHLKNVDKLDKLDDLMVFDLSGNISLDYVDKNFLKFTNLQSLNLSNTKVSTTPLFRNIGKVTHLLFRECKNLGRLRSLTSLTNLQTLDLSGATNFEEFHDPSLEKLVSLRTLDLSGTSLQRLPLNIANPLRLYLKSCLKLQQLSCIDSLVDIEVLDLSGSMKLKDLEDDFFDRMTRLRVLNLSETNVSFLPSFSKLSNLRELFLSRCTSLKTLPSLESATKLEVLDVSKCSALEDIGNRSFKGMNRLNKLDLSETRVNYLPALPNPSNLRQLLLKNCINMQNFELNVSLVNLEVLNLAGIPSLTSNGAELVKDMSKLQLLDLSYTSLEQLPSMSNIKKLTHLSLAGCKRLETVPDLHHLSKLEVLDLSGSSVKCLPTFSSSNNIQKLLLKDCSIGEDFPDVKVSDLLWPVPNVDVNNLREIVPDVEVSDLRGALPLGISTLSHLDYLELPNIKESQTVERNNEELAGKEINQDQWNICQLSDNDKPPLFLSGIQFLHVPKEILLSKRKFHLCALPIAIQGETGDRYLQRNELVFESVYLQTPHFAEYKDKRSLQIRGFNLSPKGIENVISHINLVFLIDNKFKSLLSGLSLSVFSELSAIWIERCNDMVSVFDEKEREVDPKFKIALENLGISNNRRLTSICNGTFESFNNLKTLYLDGCPQLLTVFQSSWLPKTLKVLQIKHCDKMLSLFEAEGELPCLETLHLWELPELESIGISLPSLQTLQIYECPKFKQIEENFEFAKGLKSLWICGATSLKSLYTGNQESHNFVNLETLKLENCPMLENVISSTSPLKNIKIIEIRSCEKLQTLFSHSNLVSYELPSLNTLQLEDLPMLKSIGATSPSLQKRPEHIFECPNLQFEG